MRAHMTMWDITKRGEPARSFVSMARRPGEMQSLMGCSWFRLGVNSRILVFCCRAGVGR
jgi:hypothetical protein